MENGNVVTDSPQDTSSNPWEAAFAALNKTTEEDTQTTSTADPAPTDNQQAPTETDANPNTSEADPANSNGAQNTSGESDSNSGNIETSDGNNDNNAVTSVTEEEIEAYRKTFESNLNNRTINEVAQAYIEKGARNTNGKLGATINDEDICKRDSDGVPHFYNPETGREFTGDNPRRQAQDWVDDYNKELSKLFNETCQQYYDHLMETEGHQLRMIEFAPKYEQLDDVRKAMFDAVVEDYEIKDNNNDVIGYSIDLNKALNAVNRQITAMQAKFGNASTSSSEPVQKPTGPVLDTPSTTGSSNSQKPEFKSIAEAMEWEQDQLIARMKEKN